MYSDADAAALYDLLNPWDPETSPADAFYHSLTMAAGSVLDVGCGTGGMLRHARDRSHAGRLVGLDPDPSMVDRARRRPDIEWFEGTAADAPWHAEFDLAVMTGHAFQFLADDAVIRGSLAAIRTALRPGAAFAFETRHPQARGWESWNPANASDIIDHAGRPLRIWYQVESVVDDLVTFTGTVATPDGTVVHTDRTGLRFLAPARLDSVLAEAGFTVESRYGDWDRSPVTETSGEIITIARRG